MHESTRPPLPRPALILHRHREQILPLAPATRFRNYFLFPTILFLKVSTDVYGLKQVMKEFEIVF